MSCKDDFGDSTGVVLYLSFFFFSLFWLFYAGVYSGSGSLSALAKGDRGWIQLQ